MIDLDLHKTAILSIESRGGRKQVSVHIGNQRMPLANWADLEEEVSPCILGPGCLRQGASRLPEEEDPSSHCDSSAA
jgi:hypothetical protein